MPANDVKFGICRAGDMRRALRVLRWRCRAAHCRHAGTLIDSVETDDSVQVKELPGSNGEIARVNAWRSSALLHNAERTPHGRRSANTDADALNLLQLVAALTAVGIPLDDDCPYLETRELVEGAERRLVTWTLKAKSVCGQYDARKLI